MPALAQPLHRHGRRVQALGPQRVRQRPAAHQCGRQGCGAGGALDAVAALPHQPEEARAGIVEADHQFAVGDEAAQPRPGGGGPADMQRGGGLDAVDGQRDVQLFGLHVLRVGGVGIGR